MPRKKETWKEMLCAVQKGRKEGQWNSRATRKTVRLLDKAIDKHVRILTTMQRIRDNLVEEHNRLSHSQIPIDN